MKKLLIVLFVVLMIGNNIRLHGSHDYEDRHGVRNVQRLSTVEKTCLILMGLGGAGSFLFWSKSDIRCVLVSMF